MLGTVMGGTDKFHIKIAFSLYFLQNFVGKMFKLLQPYGFMYRGFWLAVRNYFRKLLNCS